MPSIQFVEKKAGYHKLEVVRLYKEMFGGGLKEAVELIDFVENCEIPVALTDIVTATHFIYRIQKFGLVCKLSSGSAPELKMERTQ